MKRHVFSLLVLLAGIVSARAQVGPPNGGLGGWKVTYSYSGSNSPVAPGESATWLNPPDSSNTSAWGSYSGETPSTLTVTTEGDVTITVVWDGRDVLGNLLPAPDHVSVLIEASAGILGEGKLNGPPSRRVSPGYDLNNGFGDPVTEFPGPKGLSAHCGGKHIKTFKYTGSPITITKHLKAQAWVTAQGSFLTAVVDLTATAQTRAAYLVPKDVQVEWRADGDLNAHTIFELFPLPNTPEFSEVHNLQHFEWTLEGPWSQTSIWDSQMGWWNGPNVSIGWEGLDASYTFTPRLFYTYNYNGCYLQRDMDDLLQDFDIPYSGSPTPKELTLKVADLVEGVSAEQKLYLSVHAPIDDWVQDSVVTYQWPRQYIVELQLDPSGKLTTSYDVERTFSETSTAEVSTEFPVKTPFVAIPISVKLGHEFSKTVSQHFTAQSELSAPPSAVSVVFFVRKKMDKLFGRVSSWNRAGLVGAVQQTPCEWFDPNTFRPYLGWFFKNANGEEM